MEVIDYSKKVFSTREFGEARAYTVETLVNDILDDYGVPQEPDSDFINIVKHDLKASRDLEEINDIFKEIITISPH